MILKETLFTKAVITDAVLNNDEQMQMSELSLGKVFSVCLCCGLVSAPLLILIWSHLISAHQSGVE
jgi:hypothetical protein